MNEIIWVEIVLLCNEIVPFAYFSFNFEILHYLWDSKNVKFSYLFYSTCYGGAPSLYETSWKFWINDSL